MSVWIELGCDKLTFQNETVNQINPVKPDLRNNSQKNLFFKPFIESLDKISKKVIKKKNWHMCFLLIHQVFMAHVV